MISDKNCIEGIIKTIEAEEIIMKNMQYIR